MTMKRVLVGVGVAVVVVAAGALVLRQTRYARVSTTLQGQSQQGRPWFGLADVGFSLSGEEVTTPVTDWSFASRPAGVTIQINPWWGIPYTVKTSIVAGADGKKIYLVSDYFAPPAGGEDLRGRFPEARGWNRHILRDPRIRVQIADKGVYNFLVYPLTDREEIESVRRVFLQMVPSVREQFDGPEEQRPRVHVFGLIPQWGIEAVRDAHAKAAHPLS
ncbi:MAG: hypothetical protein AB7I25_00180 [Vicinamibacterales bacterium]